MIEGLRQAALAVASLDPEDRAWLVAQLGDAEREVLEAVLEHDDVDRNTTSLGSAEAGGAAFSAQAGKPVRGDASYLMSSKVMPPKEKPGGAASSGVAAANDTSAFARLKDQLASEQRELAIVRATTTSSETGTPPVSQPAIGFNADGAGGPGPSAARQRLIDAQSREVFMLLSGEPDWMVAAVCGLHRWHWLAELLRLFGDDRAARITALARAQPEHGAGVRHALIELLGERLLAGGMALRFDACSEGVARGMCLRGSRGRLGRVFGRLTSWLL